ncbi:MAG: NUDIX domain-containing protein [Clostridia bacterium]|nr:NUDIX domain-containing protein [Clostridia bacterium]
MNNKPTTVLAIGRWMPIHIGHKSFLTGLARSYDRLVVGIGSCYENGTPRNCIPAIEREKLLRKIFNTEGLDNVIIVPIQDRESFEEWFDDVIKLCESFDVTHFCTGNKEDILDVMKEKGLTLDVEFINPEQTSDFPYHATDIRNAILRGETDRLDSMIPAEIKNEVLGQVAKEIARASEGRGQKFIPGRQTVDIVFVVDDSEREKKYLLIGKRNGTKTDFPNCYAIPGSGIPEFESPIDAACRSLKMETGVEISITDNSCEPARIILNNLGGKAAEMYFTGIYASADESINGTRGGGSQCFAIVIKDSIDKVKEVLVSEHDMDELLLIDVDEVHKTVFAFDQKRMVLEAFAMLGVACDNGELLQAYNEDATPADKGVSRSEAHSQGILHGASHTYLYRFECGRLMLLLQRRSMNKDSYAGCLDASSAGHVEYGSDFLETAIKELEEELGVHADSTEPELIFEQKVRYENVFHGRRFVDSEYNCIYAIEWNKDTAFRLQTTEVSEVVWMSAEDILASIESNRGEICTAPEEMKKVIGILQTKIK